jgi:hypothetical protein
VPGGRLVPKRPVALLLGNLGKLQDRWYGCVLAEGVSGTLLAASPHKTALF